MWAALISALIIVGVVGAAIVEQAQSNPQDEYDDVSHIINDGPAPYRQITFIVSDDSNDCYSDEDYYLLLKVTGHPAYQIRDIDCKNGELYIEYWVMSFGENTSNVGSISLPDIFDIRRSSGTLFGWTTNEFYWEISRFDSNDETWKIACRTPTLHNAFDVKDTLYCGEWNE